MPQRGPDGKFIPGGLYTITDLKRDLGKTDKPGKGGGKKNAAQKRAEAKAKADAAARAKAGGVARGFSGQQGFKGAASFKSLGM